MGRPPNPCLPASYRHLAAVLPRLPSVRLVVIGERTLRCDCGFEVSSRDESDFLQRAQQHAASAHHMQLTEEQLLMAAFRSELAREGELPSE